MKADSADFTLRDCSFDGVSKPVLTLGDAGPAVIVMHEVFGFTPELARFCRWLRDGGLRVYAPILLGTPDASNPVEISAMRTLGLCISREFTVLASNKSSPITDWLRGLARLAHAECGGPGVGAIGMCLTGGFALSMAIDPVLLAPVLAQPSLPALNAGALDISPSELETVKARAREGLEIRGYRFAGDTLCRGQRFETLQREFGAAFRGVTLPDSSANPTGMARLGKPPHSVFTADLIDAQGEPTRQAADEVVAFFRARLGVAAG